MTWISFTTLPPNFFVKKSLYSLASTVDKPQHVDLATQNKTRRRCACVKVEVDLLAELPKRVQIQVIDEANDVVRSKWIRIQCD